MAVDSFILYADAPDALPRGRFTRMWAGCFPLGGPEELWGGLALVIIPALLAALAIKWRSEAIALEQDPVTVEGKVLRLWTTPAKGSRTPHVAYEYPAPPGSAPQTFQGEGRIKDALFARLKEGAPITVKVCRTDPGNHQVVGEFPPRLSSTSFTVWLVILALPALGGINCLWWWWVCRGLPRPTSVLCLGSINVRWRRLDPESLKQE
jgi:hypothetical protein